MQQRPSVKQVYALAAALCVRMGEEFPENRLEASDLIQRLWDENGDPRAQLHPSVSVDLRGEPTPIPSP